MTPFLTIIIPAHNIEEGIKPCLDSICSQTHSKNRIQVEIIIIDDFSTDETLKYIYSYCGQHSTHNIKIIHHEKNLRQGGARNTGLRYASGKYVWFVDADDRIRDGVLMEIYNLLKNRDVDVFQFNAIKEYANGNSISENFLEQEISAMTGIEYLEYESAIKYSNRIKASWSKWYKRDYLLKNNLFFEENIYWEDVVHSLKSIYFSKTFSYKPLIGYIYVQTPNSDMRGELNGKKLADSVRFCVDSIQFLIEKNASLTIRNFVGEYYDKVLKKVRNKLHTISFNDFTFFDNNVESLNLELVRQFFNSSRHDWLLQSEDRYTIWQNQSI